MRGWEHGVGQTGKLTDEHICNFGPASQSEEHGQVKYGPYGSGVLRRDNVLDVTEGSQDHFAPFLELTIIKQAAGGVVATV
jgi:hypothetical protein